MNQVSQFSPNQITEFSIHERSSFQSKNTKTPLTKQTSLTNSTPKQILANQYKVSNYKCTQCSQHLSNLTQIKKREILLEFELQKLKQKIDRLTKQNQHLINLQYANHQINLEKYNPIMYFKEDLQSELSQTKYLLQLQLLSKSFSDNQLCIKPSIIKESKKQKQCIENLSKPYNIKKKCEELLLQNIKLQEKNMIKDKIIEDRSLFPLYHYDQRILLLRKNVQFWYRKAEQQSSKLCQAIDDIKKTQKQLKKEAKMMVEQERIYWQDQLKRFSQQLFKSFNFNQNQVIQNLIHKDQKKNNILIEDDHTIISLCEKMKQKKPKLKSKQNYQRSNKQNGCNICQSCLFQTSKKLDKKTISNFIDKSNNSSKNSGKLQSKYISAKHSDTFSRQNSINMKRKRKSRGQNNNSLLGKNFANIEIKQKQKHQDKTIKIKSSCAEMHQKINCLRCANKIV